MSKYPNAASGDKVLRFTLFEKFHRLPDTTYSASAVVCKGWRVFEREGEEGERGQVDTHGVRRKWGCLSIIPTPQALSRLRKLKLRNPEHCSSYSTFAIDTRPMGLAFRYLLPLSFLAIQDESFSCRAGVFRCSRVLDDEAAMGCGDSLVCAIRHSPLSNLLRAGNGRKGGGPGLLWRRLFFASSLIFSH